MLSGHLKLEPGQRWYVVFTQPGKEHVVAQNLINQGFRCFVPRQTTSYKHSRRVETRHTPVFPQYMFVIVDPTKQRWRAVNGTIGVRRLIGDGDGPTPVHTGVVEAILSSCDRNGLLTPQSSSLQPGDRVKLVSGPFAGMIGTLQKLNASGRVQILLDIMSGRISASADAAAVSPDLDVGAEEK